MSEVEPANSPLLTPGMRSRLGIWTPWGTPSPPISQSDIRRWAIAVYWDTTPPRMFWDEDYARATRWGGIVAPVEFNPFAWPPPTETEPARSSRHAGRRVNGGCRMRFGAPMRPGDCIEARSRIESWQSKSGRSGELLLVDFRHQWRNQRGEGVRDAVHTLIYS
ncbi:MaoC family dehydratase N-terminal domain-containing protein [Mycobacterium sp. 1245111.1]|uniref:FAS1-like dehydratase domain-containing protein n=1 Tax=Mycobacterium sp. 1245111.1 TaxID=1834073 RepID=UPI000B1DD97D|nr:MaoC family dehydratase N-terminal domain-containing protein [Mycobacterium sp. 1245111.1]